jgi:hypothetical protein
VCCFHAVAVVCVERNRLLLWRGESDSARRLVLWFERPIWLLLVPCIANELAFAPFYRS